VICEGYATAATLHDATGDAVAVAFDCGNLARVAAKLRERYPRAEIVIAADNDRFTDGNPGLTAARTAAGGVRARVAVPMFANSEDGTDWNDFALSRGVAAVRSWFAEALS
jgi:putative DNA primase/helicase